MLYIQCSDLTPCDLKDVTPSSPQCYTQSMKNSIAQKNKYLSDPRKLREALRRAATTSTAVEGVHIDQHKEASKKVSRKTSRNSK